MKKNKGTELEVKNGEEGQDWGYGGQRSCFEESEVEI